MKIGIIGATGTAGSAVYREAVQRGHEVTAIVRSHDKAIAMLGTDAAVIVKDAFQLSPKDLSAFDVVVNAFASAPDHAYLHLDLAARMVSLLRRQSGPRLFFILGAGSLYDDNDQLLIESLRQDPSAEAWIAVPENQYKQLQFLRLVDDVSWVGVSPSLSFVAGEKTVPNKGKDHVMKSQEGHYQTTSGTLAVAILDEIENPEIFNDRFTVSDS